MFNYRLFIILSIYCLIFPITALALILGIPFFILLHLVICLIIIAIVHSHTEETASTLTVQFIWNCICLWILYLVKQKLKLFEEYPKTKRIIFLFSLYYFMTILGVLTQSFTVGHLILFNPTQH